MKNQNGPKPKGSKFTPEQEKKIYNKILKGERPTDFSGQNPRGNKNANWDKSFVIDVGDGDKIRVWEVNGKLTYPHEDPNFSENKLYREKFSKAVKNYRPVRESNNPSIEKVTTQSGKVIFLKKRPLK